MIAPIKHFPSPDRKGGVHCASKSREPLPHGQGWVKRYNSVLNPTFHRSFIQRDRFKQISAILFCAISIIFSTGCPGHHIAPISPPRPLADIIDTINRNNAQLTQPLYVPVVDVSASLTDDDNHRHALNLRGKMVIRAPRSLWLQLDHTLESDQLRLGSNDTEYWLIIRRNFSTMWWGKHQHLGKPCVRPLKLDPGRFADALGLITLPNQGALGPYRISEERFDRLLYGRMTDGNSARLDRAYLIDRREPYMLRGVTFYDTLGREELQLSLDDYRPLDKSGPLLARKIALRWPMTGDWMRLDLSGIQIKPSVHPKTFERPQTAPPGINKLIQIDADCDQPPLPTSMPALH